MAPILERLLSKISNLAALRDVQSCFGEPMVEHKFVEVMAKYLVPRSAITGSKSDSSSDLSEIAELCELFSKIDVLGSGTVSWDYFSSFLIDHGSGGSASDVTYGTDHFKLRGTSGARSSSTKYEVQSLR
jgi:hypothetical protein